MIAEALLLAAGIYLICGLFFAVPFVLVGVSKIDPHAEHGSWGFRLLIIPGTMFLWPLLARRWVMGVHEPPEEDNPHRGAERNAGTRQAEAGVDSESASGNRQAEIDQSLVTSAATRERKGAPR